MFNYLNIYFMYLHKTDDNDYRILMFDSILFFIWGAEIVFKIF